MKVRKGRSQRIVVEMDRTSPALPPIALPEFRLNRILVPVDFSECSRKALEYGVSFAKQFSAEVMLLHVVVAVPQPPQMPVLEAESLRAKYHEEAAKRLSEWRKKVVSRASVKAIVRQGISAHEEIIAAAQECNSDLIVVGNHGRSGLARVLTGSTAERVVRHAPCPVLVVRGREHEFLVGAREMASVEKSVAV